MATVREQGQGRRRVKLIAVVGSQREYGNSFLLTKEALKPFKEINYEIVQLATRDIEFCNICGKCQGMECPLNDDFNEILGKMREADGIVLAYPKYVFSVPTKLLCFLERLDLMNHFRKRVESDYIEDQKVEHALPVPLDGKPCCLFAVTDPEEKVEECLDVVGNEVRSLGMKLILFDSQLGAYAVGRLRGEVLRDQKGIDDCRKLVTKLVNSISSENGLGNE
jgi:multimeric flavodoxin WrbA